MPKARRHQLLTEVLKNGPVASQDELAEALAQAGEPATQTTISRDLKELGALKGPEGYTLPVTPTLSVSFQEAPVREASVGGVLANHILRVSQAASMVVLHTAPGHAPFVAAQLDAAPPAQAVGTIAGDDTIFIATESEQAAADLTARMLELARLGAA
ncbi:MAG: arginine repressor [Phycisphaerales bacterium JB040]